MLFYIILYFRLNYLDFKKKLQDSFRQFITQLSMGSYLTLLVEHLDKIIKVNSHRFFIL